MAARWRPGPEHRSEATQRLFSGLTRGDEVFELAKAIADLHPKDNTFPGEVFISIAVDALDAAGIDRDTPLLYEGLPGEAPGGVSTSRSGQQEDSVCRPGDRSHARRHRARPPR